MYWIYLAIFILAVFSPDIVHRGLFFFNKDASANEIRMMEELSIFIFGIIGFLIFLWKEKQLKSSMKEKSKIQTEMSQASRDLKDSYSYIGEINRKLDILKNIALGFPEDSLPPSPHKLGIYDAITEALKILCKTNDFTVRLADETTNNTVKEITGHPKMVFKIKNNALKLMADKDYVKNDDYHIFRSPQKIDNIRTYVIIQRKPNGRIEDPGLIKTLTTQILFIHSLSKKYKAQI